MPKITIEIEDAYKDGKSVLKSRFNVDDKGRSPDDPPTNAQLFGYVVQELWRHSTWQGLAMSMCPEVFEYRARVAQAQAAAQAQQQAAILDAKQAVANDPEEEAAKERLAAQRAAAIAAQQGENAA